MIQTGARKRKKLLDKTKSYLGRRSTWIITAGIVALAISTGYLIRYKASSSEQRLLKVEHDLNDIYRRYRPFPYRWPGVPYAAEMSPPQKMPNKLLGREKSMLDQAEFLQGITPFSLRLRGRISLLAGDYGAAIDNYHLASLRFPEDTNLRLELSISFAMRAQSEHRALDYERALQTVLGIPPDALSPEVMFDTALLFQQVPLPEQAVEKWEKAIAAEPLSTWRQEEEKRLSDQKYALQAREDRIGALTASPSSYLANAHQAGNSLEFVVETAMSDWLPRANSSTNDEQALASLADALNAHYGDPWLLDLLATNRNTAAVRALSESWNANEKGYHVRAEHFAILAERLFHRAGNPAGELRSRVEQVYALDRQELPVKCMRALAGLRDAAHSRHYIWIEGQSWLEEITCQTETRNADVIAVRHQAYDWLRKTGYEVLQLRALSFLTEEEVSFGSRLSIWENGRHGLQIFWKDELPPGRGYTFYNTMAISARAAGDELAALSLLREGVQLLKKSPHQQLLALVLSHLGSWESEAGFYADADTSFREMEAIYSQFGPSERQALWREAEVMHAKSEITAGQPQKAISRLKTLTRPSFSFSSLSPVERWQLLPTIGDAYLASGDLNHASKYYDLIIQQTREGLRTVKDPVQRNTAQWEIEAAWKGMTEIHLLRGQQSLAWKTWEEYRAAFSKNKKPSRFRLPENMSVLIYVFLHKGLSGWLVQRGGFHQCWLDGRKIKGDAERFAALVADKDSPLPEVQDVAKNLYGVLIQPFQSYLSQGDRLVVDAERPLTQVPWTALIDEHNDFLVTKFAISQMQGWPNLKEESLRFDKPLIVIDPAIRSDLAGLYRSLQQASHEGDYLQKTLSNSVVINGENATLTAMSKLLPQSTMLHFGGHGVSHGGFGALLLAPERNDMLPARLMTAAEISTMKLDNLDLVVLAACSSGAGEQSGTVDLDSLVQSFLRAGAHRVVAARWNITSNETEDIVEHFYDKVVRKQPPDEALRSAAAQISKATLTRRPYYWAGLQLFGAP